MAFRDEFERKAHDIICIVKYGSPGGSATPKEVQRIGDILRGHPLRAAVVVPPLPAPVRMVTIPELVTLTCSAVIPPLPPKVL